MNRGFLLGNCQADTMAGWMRSAAPGIDFQSGSIAGVAPGDPNAKAAWSAAIASADVVFSQMADAHMAQFGLPAEAEITAAGKRFMRLPVVAFKGFQPDCTYVFIDGHPLSGAMGPYHSAIAAAAFLEGLSAERALGLFNAFVYAALGYFSEYEAAATVLGEQAAEMGLDLGTYLQPGAPVFMHTVNHPAVSILGQVAMQALARTGVSPHPVETPPHDHLGDSYRWPVYPEIAQRLGVAGGLTFQGCDGADDRIDLRTVVEATYAAMAAAAAAAGGVIVLDQDKPMATPVIERAQDFIRRHVIA